MVVGQTVWAPRNAGELLYWPATVVSLPFETNDKIRSVQIQYYGPASQPASVPVESLQSWNGSAEVAKQHLAAVVNPSLMQLLADAIVQATKQLATSPAVTYEESYTTDSTNSANTNTSVTLSSHHNHHHQVDPMDGRFRPDGSSYAPGTAPSSTASSSSTSSPMKNAPSPSSAETKDTSIHDHMATPIKSEPSLPAAVASTSSDMIPIGSHVRMLQASIVGQIGVVLAVVGDIYTVRLLATNMTYQLPRYMMEVWSPSATSSVVAATSTTSATATTTTSESSIVKSDDTNGSSNDAAATAAAAVISAQAQAALFYQQQSFATAEPYIGQAVRVTKGEGSTRTGTIVAWQPEYYAFRVRLGNDEVLKRNDELELLTAPVYRLLQHQAQQQAAQANGTATATNTNAIPSSMPPVANNGMLMDPHSLAIAQAAVASAAATLNGTPAASTRAQQPILVQPNTLSDKKRKPHVPRTKSVRNLVGKYVMIEAGRYKGEIGFVAKGGNGYYGVIKLPGMNDTMIETQPVMKRSADLRLVQLTPEQRQEHERGVAKYFPHLVPPPPSLTPPLEALPTPIDSTSSMMPPLVLPSYDTPAVSSSSSSVSSMPAVASSSSSQSSFQAPQATNNGHAPTSTSIWSSSHASPTRPQRQVRPPSPTADQFISDDELVDEEDHYDDNGNERAGGNGSAAADRQALSKRKRRAHLTPVGSKTESWVDRRVLVTVGKYRGEVGTIIKSGHGFYCVDIPNRGEVMKRAAELELYDVGGTIPVMHGHAPASDAKLRKAAFILIDLMKDRQAEIIWFNKRAKLSHNDDDHSSGDYEEPITTVFGRPARRARRGSTAESSPSSSSSPSTNASRESKTVITIDDDTTDHTDGDYDHHDDTTATATVTSTNTNTTSSNSKKSKTKPTGVYNPSSYAARNRHQSTREEVITMDSKKEYRPRYINAAGLAPL